MRPTVEDEPTPAPLRTILRDHRLDIALVALLLSIVAPFVQTLTAQGATRYTLTAALVEQRTIRLDDYEPIIGVDRVEIDGHIYSDKAPGQPVLGVPVLALAGALGAEPATDYRLSGNLGIWSQTLVFCTIPGALLLVLMRRNAARTQTQRSSAVAAAGLSFTTMLLPFSSALYGHVLAALLGFAAWHLVSTPQPRTRNFALAGFLVGLAVTVEYPMALLAVLLTMWLSVKESVRTAAIFVACGAAFIPLLLGYNRLAYGTNATGYSSKGDSGRLNFFAMPNPSNVADILFGVKGFVFTPIVLVGIAALILLVGKRRDLLLPACFFGGFFLLQAGWPNPWGGSGPGPRYIAPALPFLVVSIAWAVDRLRPVATAVLLGFGAFSMGLVMVTYELVPDGSSLITAHLHHLATGPGWNPTVFTMAVGPAGWLLHGMLVAASVIWVARCWPSADGAVVRVDTTGSGPAPRPNRTRSPS